MNRLSSFTVYARRYNINPVNQIFSVLWALDNNKGGGANSGILGTCLFQEGLESDKMIFD